VTLQEIAKLLDGKILIPADDSLDIYVVGATDLMSDALAFMQPGALMLTGLTNPQVVRTAEMGDIKGICFVRGKQPEPEALEMAQTHGMPVLTTPFPMFKACGLLWTKGLKPCF